MKAQEHYPAWFGLILPLGLVVVWEASARMGFAGNHLPAPSIVLRQMTTMAISGELEKHLFVSLYRALFGFAIGAFFGIVVGLLAGLFRPVETFYEPLVSLTYPVPKIAALPIVFAWFGLGNLSKIIIIVVSVFYPLYIASVAGAKSASKVHIWAARNMGASRLTILLRVLLPSAMPQIFNGLRVGLALSFVVMFVAELVSSNEGLGYLIVYAEQSNRFDMMYVSILTIALIGFVADRAVLQLRKRVLVGQGAALESRI